MCDVQDQFWWIDWNCETHSPQPTPTHRIARCRIWIRKRHRRHRPQSSHQPAVKVWKRANLKGNFHWPHGNDFPFPVIVIFSGHNNGNWQWLETIGNLNLWRHCQGETFASVLAQERAQSKSRERDAFLSFRLWLLPLCKVIIDMCFLKICWHIWFPNAQMCPIYHLRQRWHRNHLAVAGACRGAEYDGVATRWRLDATWWCAS